MNKWPIILGTLCAILSGVLFGGSSVSAASIYDDVVQLIDPLIIPASGSGGTGDRDYSLDWYNEALAAAEQRCNSVSPGDGCQIVDDLQNLLDDPNANWAVTYHSGASGYYIVYSFDPSAETNIGEFTVGITGSNIKHVGPFTYRPNDTTEYVTENKTRLMSSSIGAGNIALSQSNLSALIFLSTFPVTYPVGYEGEIIPDTYNPPVVYDWVPDFYALQGIDYKVTIQDKNFNTFDEVPFTCNDGLTPVIKYEIRDSDNEIVVIGQFSATIQLEQQLPKKNIESTYTIIGNYDCGYFLDPTQPDFSGQASKEFTITAGGLLKNEVFTSCFTETAPFVDFENCINNMADTVGMLSFGSIKFNNNWQFDSNCRELAVLGSWLGLEGSSKVICPQFPEYIRNVVTPFVTLLLGFITLKFVTSRGGSGI